MEEPALSVKKYMKRQDDGIRYLVLFTSVDDVGCRWNTNYCCTSYVIQIRLQTAYISS